MKEIYSYLNKFLWFCSGAEINVLQDLPSERIKYKIIGIIVIANSIFASLSGSYAFHQVIGSFLNSILLGVIWGLLIFNLQRFLILSITIQKGLSKLIPLLFRLLMSIFIGLIIVTPIELKLFEKSINKRIIDNNIDHIKQQVSKIKETQTTIQNEIKYLLNELKIENIKVNDFQQSYISEIDGTGGTGNVGLGYAAQAKLNIYKNAEKNYYEHRKKTDTLIFIKKERIFNLNNTINDIRKSYLTSNNSFIEKQLIFNELINEDNYMRTIHILFSLLFIMISSFPVLLLSFSTSNDYQKYIKRRNEVILDDLEFKLSQSNDLRKKTINDITPISSENKENMQEYSSFEFFIKNILNSLTENAKISDNSSQWFLKTGLIINIVGIAVAFVFLLFWVDFFKTNEFKIYHYSEIISGVIITLLIEFLGSWFLKRHKELSLKSLEIIKIKTIIGRYLLIYYSINEFVEKKERKEYVNNLINAINKELIFPLSNTKSNDKNFSQGFFSTISNLTDTIKDISKKT